MNTFFGTDYYPEHWSEERWETDARLMAEMGVSVVRLGEFSWHAFEPEEGRYQFDWLDRAIDVLAGHGIRVILGTPTAAPPAWLIKRHPDYLPVDDHGVRRAFGGRHHDCQSAPGYRASVRALVTAMAEHYAEHPAVIGWQIDNELGNSHDDLCYCESCQAAFRRWLQERYLTIDRLNAAWGTVFWSQTYNSFDEIPAPALTPNVHNPSHVLAWKRFCSDLIVSFLEEQAQILRRICPRHLITHNFMGFSPKTDYYDLAQKVDVVSDDRYPTGFYLPEDYTWVRTPAAFDLTRSFKDQNFWVMEMQSGPTGTRMIGETPRPGELALWAATAVAHGADSVVWFRWRSCLFGPEQFWYGILPHSGQPGRRYEELKRLIAQLRPIMEDVAGICTRGQAAILFDFNQWWALQEQPLHPRLDYVRMLCSWYEAFYRQNLPVDFCGPDADLSRYRLVIAPLTQLCGPELRQRLTQFVRQGGTAVLTYRAAIKDEENVCREDGEPPCGLNELIGGYVRDFNCLYHDQPIDLYWAEGRRSQAALWQDELQVTTAEVAARAGLPGEEPAPVITVNRYGRGAAWYVGTELAAQDLRALVGSMARQSGLEPTGRSEEQVELRVREGRKNDYLFALNSTPVEQRCELAPQWQPMDGCDSAAVPPFGVRLWYRPKEAAGGHTAS